MPEGTIPAAEWEWYEEYYRRVINKAASEMGDRVGVVTWLAENDPETYSRINQADDLLNTLWKSRGDRAEFKNACKSWYDLWMAARSGFDAWQVRQREAAMNVGKQEALL